MAGFRIISPRPSNSEQVCSIVPGLLFSFAKKFAQGATQLCWQISVVLIFHIRNVYKIVAYDVFAVFAVLRTGKGGKYSFKILGKSKIGLFLVC